MYNSTKQFEEGSDQHGLTGLLSLSVISFFVSLAIIPLVLYTIPESFRSNYYTQFEEGLDSFHPRLTGLLSLYVISLLIPRLYL